MQEQITSIVRVLKLCDQGSSRGGVEASSHPNNDTRWQWDQVAYKAIIGRCTRWVHVDLCANDPLSEHYHGVSGVVVPPREEGSGAGVRAVLSVPGMRGELGK